MLQTASGVPYLLSPGAHLHAVHPDEQDCTLLKYDPVGSICHVLEGNTTNSVSARSSTSFVSLDMKGADYSFIDFDVLLESMKVGLNEGLGNTPRAFTSALALKGCVEGGVLLDEEVRVQCRLLSQ